MDFDYGRLRVAAVRDMSATLAEVGDDQWEAPSLCNGWQVRHVPAHLVTGYLLQREHLGEMVARWGSVLEAAKWGAIEFAADHDARAIVQAFERNAGQAEPTGMAAVIPPPDVFIDQLLHRLDVAIPLDLSRRIPEEHLLAALDAMPSVEGLIGGKVRATGLRLIATDLPWTWGDGPEVRGPGEAILLALSGRPCGLSRCEGDGVELLAAKQGVAGHR